MDQNANPRNLHMALDQDAQGNFAIRTLTSITNVDPIPVTLGSQTITITGNVNVGTSVSINNTTANPVINAITEVGTSGILTVPYLPIGGTVTANQGTTPWTVGGTVTANQGATPYLVAQSTSPWTIAGTVTANQGTTPWTISGTVTANQGATPYLVNQGTNPWNILGTVTANQGPTPYIVNQGTSPWIVGGTVTVNSSNTAPIYNIPADSSALTAFSRQRTSSTRLLGEFRTFYGTTGNNEMLTVTANGGSVTTNLTGKYKTLTVTSTAGSNAIRQSRQYHPYIPGTSQLCLVTFVFGAAQAGLQQYVGFYDNNDGIFFRMNGTIPEMVIRKGGVDTEVVANTQWNIDTMNGTGPSGLTLDYTKAQILVVDYQWLGVGRVRVGFDVDGIIWYVHHFHHANIVTLPYTQQPSLPVRWELLNVSGTGGSMTEICYSVYCEGEDYETGFQNSASNNTTPISITSTTQGYGMLAVRLQNSVNGIPVKAFARLKNWSIITSNDVFYKILILQGAASISGTPTWTPCTPTGWCEYTTNFILTSDPGTNTIVLYEGYASGNNGNTGNIAQNFTDQRSATIYQNFDSTDSMIIAVVAYKINNNNASAYSAIDWIEIK